MIAAENSDFKVAKINVDDQPELGDSSACPSLPSVSLRTVIGEEGSRREAEESAFGNDEIGKRREDSN